ncbi:MAG: helix-turn-helix domain-containing protein [Rickettsiales bacterium]|nr:helix-turn-helix domain-containing protein [Rickettsiales bacterium]
MLKIAVKTNDGFIVNFLKKLYGDVYDDLDGCDVAIFDGVEREEILDYVTNVYVPNHLIVNINKTENFVDNIINITMPFKINTLREKINDFKNYYEKNIIKTMKGVINVNKNVFVVDDSKVVQLTTKETELIHFLYKNGESNREDLLKYVWETKVIDNKVIETTIHNIRNKMNCVGVSNFIECSDCSYSLSI